MIVGIDFGTHQTKVCICDDSNPRRFSYKFLEFKKSNGNATIIFPSIVQVNNDETISYGFVDDSRVWKKPIITDTTPEEPKLLLPKEPNYEQIPAGPTLNEGNDWKSKLHSLTRKIIPQSDPQYKNWLKKKKSIERSNEAMRLIWENQCKETEKKFNIAHEQWLANLQYEKKYFRYFKQATFFNTLDNNTQNKQNAEIISTLYLTYICFCIRNEIGNKFSVVLGAPIGFNKVLAEEQKNTAKRIWATAMKMAECYETKEKFLRAKARNLIEKINEINKTTGIESNAYISPEASAAVLVAAERIPWGMCLLVDIGGGTTDIGMFTRSQLANNNQPITLHRVYSFPKGLNFIFEKYQEAHTNLNLTEIQDLFENGDRREFQSAIQEYCNALTEQLRLLVNDIYSDLLNGGFDRNNIIDAMTNRPIYLCGGGVIYQQIRDFSTENIYFADKQILNANLLGINVDEDLQELSPILITSYGLATPNPFPNDNIPLGIITPNNNNNNDNQGMINDTMDYGLIQA